MKNGRALKGHRRIEVGVGMRQSRRHPMSGGWNVGCMCGWDGGNHRNAQTAKNAYKAHIDYLIDRCPFVCKRCGGEKPLSQMRPDYRYICLDCFSKMGNEWQAKHPKESARHKRNHSLLKRFGMTADEADALLVEQGGVCAICCDFIADKRGYAAHVDHDHVTGQIRGILCFGCNAGLGQFKDDPGRLRAAIVYLERWAEQ